MVSMLLGVVTLLLTGITLAAPVEGEHEKRSYGKIVPKVFIINAFAPEADVFLSTPEFNLYGRNLTLPGLSPQYPTAHCTADGQVCQVTTGEGEINAAISIHTITTNSLFDLTKTYFLVGGIGGVNPERATIGSVTFSRFEIQVAQQYEIDIRELGANYSTPYIPYGETAPGEYPKNFYGTEVFEVNANLRDRAVKLARKNTLNDSDTAVAYRALYTGPNQKPARQPPSIVACDGATSDVYYSGSILAAGFDKFSTLITNGTAKYCISAQEDSAILEAMLRSAKAKLVDFSRIILMRSAANFERQPPGQIAAYHLFYANSGGFLPSIRNLNIAGIPIVEDILSKWDDVYCKGIKAKNYIGDVFGTLGGIPDFGPYPYFGVA